mmetsp:Transcript_28716/g.42275  ORF Transcript_28716/g.42275 Transcript_28716/m.42275 type:complete len:417 (+) Transcript_28716:50-1300(+)
MTPTTRSSKRRRLQKEESSISSPITKLLSIGSDGPLQIMLSFLHPHQIHQIRSVCKTFQKTTSTKSFWKQQWLDMPLKPDSSSQLISNGWGDICAPLYVGPHKRQEAKKGRYDKKTKTADEVRWESSHELSVFAMANLRDSIHSLWIEWESSVPPAIPWLLRKRRPRSSSSKNNGNGSGRCLYHHRCLHGELMKPRSEMEAATFRNDLENSFGILLDIETVLVLAKLGGSWMHRTAKLGGSSYHHFGIRIFSFEKIMRFKRCCPTTDGRKNHEFDFPTNFFPAYQQDDCALSIQRPQCCTSLFPKHWVPLMDICLPRRNRITNEFVRYVSGLVFYDSCEEYVFFLDDEEIKSIDDNDDDDESSNHNRRRRHRRGNIRASEEYTILGEFVHGLHVIHAFIEWILYDGEIAFSEDEEE